MNNAGIAGLQSQITNIDTQIAEANESLRQGKNVQGERLAPMELISTRQQTLENRARDVVNTLGIQKQALVDQYNASLSNVQMIMN
jgi:hypothetical protein